MRFSRVLPFVAAFGFAIAAPTEKRQTEVVQDYNVPPGGDVTILNYALTLEYLERKFYMEGLKNFTQAQFVAAGFADPFYNNLKEIYYDEQVHVSTLSGALGSAAVQEASYKFPYTDVKSFLALSSVLEGVGVSAYLGAAAEIANKAYLTVAGSILTVESRHSSYIRAALGESPFPKPFDTPLDFNQVYSLAAQFITGFAPGAAPLPFKAFAPLTIQPSQYPYSVGSPVTFTAALKNAQAQPNYKAGQDIYAVLFSGLDTYYVKTYETRGNGGDLKIAAPGSGGVGGIPGASDGKLAPSGQVYIVLSTADGVNTKVNDANTVSGVGIVEVLVPAH